MDILEIINSSNNPMPKYAHDGDAGFDLMASESAIIPPNSVSVVDTGITVVLPPKTVGLVCSRSGLSTRGIVVNNAPGVIDEGYRGTIKIIIRNQNDTEYHINVGDRIAQFLVMDYRPCKIVSVRNVNSTQRGANGLGSTGV